jgi:hypothetical protein
MAYLINKFNGQQLTVLEDGSIDTTTSVTLVGRNYTGYGEIQNENFVFLLENFANSNPPSRPITGQIWYSTNTKNLSVYDGIDWKSLGSAAVSDFAPTESEGALWLDSKTQKLYIFNGEWNLIGPEGIEGFGVTKLRSRNITDSLGDTHAISEFVVDDQIIAIISKDEFTIGVESFIENFNLVKKGITFSSKATDGVYDFKLNGDVSGNAETATRLKNPRSINGAFFDGQNNITIKASTTNKLLKGSYILGTDFDGSSEVTWSVNASSNNTVGTIVSRDSSGGFSAGTITADFVGNLAGNVTAPSGTSTFDVITANRITGTTLTGNASSAEKLRTARKINGIDFDGTSDIVITANASTLSGSSLNNTVTSSNLQSVGILNTLKITDLGLFVGSNDILKVYVDGSENPVIKSNVSNKDLIIEITDGSVFQKTKFITATTSLSMGGPTLPSFIPENNLGFNLGIPNNKWKNVYSEFMIGTATTAQYADLAEKYTADADYEPGMVLMFGGSAELTLAENETNKVAGIVSTNPAYLMNSELNDTHVVSLALQGRVPCRVVGPVKKGDMLVSAGRGYAKASADSPKIGTVIGKALADFDGLEGVVEAVVGRL